MIERIIELSIRNRILVLMIAVGLTLAGVYATLNTPVDAIPDLSENQVIVFTDWMGRSPREIEDQVTYPLSRKLQGLAGVKAIRSSSEFNFSMITIIFEEGIDFYFARQRVTEKLSQANTFLPSGVVPYLAPDATALGQIFWYTVETSPSNPIDPGRLWALNKFYIGPQLNSAAGVADVAIVGGTPLEYQIDVRPEDLRAYGITIGELYAAVAKSNMPAGGGVVQKNNAEYILRSIGWIKDKSDIENTVVKETGGTPIYVKTIASVQLGTQFRRSVFEKDGNEVTGGAVLMVHRQNPLAVTERVKEKIQELQPGLPAGVHIVPAYDRTRLIHGAIHTLTEVMWHEMVIASVAILLILMHFRSVFVICVTLPLAVLFSFLLMWLLRVAGIIDIQANIMSLAGITISIGILVDQAIVMTENATHHLKAHFGDQKVRGDIKQLVIQPCRTVGRPIFFSVMIMLLSFIPVFMLSGREGKLFHPLAFTKSFAMIGVALISVTLVPALIPTFIKGRLRGEEENWIVRSFINIYKPLLTWALPRLNLVMWMFAVLLILGAGIFPLQALIGMGTNEAAWEACFLIVFAVVTFLTVFFTRGFRWQALSLAALVVFGLWAYHFPKIGVDFMPPLNEGSVLDMPVTVPRASITQAIDDLKARDALLRGFPEVESVVGKAGRADTPTDPAPLDMVETFVNFRPRELWPKRVLKYDDAAEQAEQLLTALVSQGFIQPPEVVLAKRQFVDETVDNLQSRLKDIYEIGFFQPKFIGQHAFLDGIFSSVRAALRKNVADGTIVVPPNPALRQDFVNNASQKALERFDETMRELAVLRYAEFQRELEPLLTRFAVEEVIRRLSYAGKLRWPADSDEQREIDTLVQNLTPKYGPWLVESPALEDVTQLSQDIARRLAEMGAISDIAVALELKRSPLSELAGGIAEFFGADRPTLAGELLQSVSDERMNLWREQVRSVNWELFDRGTEAFTWYALEELARGAQLEELLAGAPRGNQTEQFAEQAVRSQLGEPADEKLLQPFVQLRQQFEQPFRDRIFLWPRQGGTKGDLVDDEMDRRVVQVPGWSNIFTQPIVNRIDMLSTGVRTQIGVKVFGPDIETIEGICNEITAALKPVPGARDVNANPITGKGYVQIDIDRQQAARYGISVEDIQNEIEVALGGRAVTSTVEKRDRFPIRIRYARADRTDEESIRRLLIGSGGMGAASSTGAATAGMSAATDGSGTNMPDTTGTSTTRSGHAAAPAHATRSKPLIPLSAVADVRIVEGPAMIKSENGRLLNYVTLNVRGRDIVGFVDEAQRVVAQKVKLPEGVHLQWSGEFEHQVRAARTLRFVFPAVIVLIFVILYFTYNDLADAGLMMLAVPEALAGGAFFMYLFPKITQGWDAPPMDFSVAVWVGFIACFGMATETGIIMLVYLREAIEKRGGLENIKSLEELRQAVIEGAVHRLRPKLLTEGVAIIAIFPMVFAKGVGGEILAPMALPVLGGLLISDEVVDLFLPVRFYWVRRARWLKLHGKKQPATQAAAVLPSPVAQRVAV